MISFISVCIYNTTPTYLIATRFGLLDNYIPTFILSSLILINLFQKLQDSKIRSFLLIATGITLGFSLLVKEMSIGFVLGIFIYFLILKQFKKITLLLIPLLSVIGMYAVWALWLNHNLFIDLFIGNTERAEFGSLKFVSILQSLRFENFPIDGWWVIGLVAIFLILKHSRYMILTIPTISYLMTLMLISHNNYSWYLLPLIPFMSILTSITLYNFYLKPNIPLGLFMLLTAFSSSFYWGYTIFNLPPDINPYRLIIISLISLLLVRIYFDNKLTRFIWAVAIILIFYQLIKWNNQSVLYFIANWGSYPVAPLPHY